MSIHSYDYELVELAGMQAAAIFRNIRYWVERNAANGKNKRDGLFWTYNSITGFEKMFPYMSKSQIKYALKKLEESGLLITGNFNKDGRDRTKWYSVDFAVFKRFKAEYDKKHGHLLDGNSIESGCEDSPMHLPNLDNASAKVSQSSSTNLDDASVKVSQPLPNVNNKRKPNVNNPPNPPKGEAQALDGEVEFPSQSIPDQQKTNQETGGEPSAQIWMAKPKKFKPTDFETPEWIDRGLWDDFMAARKQLKAVNSQRALETLVDTLDEFRSQGDDPSEIIKESIVNSWKGVFKPRSSAQQSTSSNPMQLAQGGPASPQTQLTTQNAQNARNVFEKMLARGEVKS